MTTVSEAGTSVEVKPLEWPAAKLNGDCYTETVVGQYGVGTIGRDWSVMLRVIRDGQDHDVVVARGLASAADAKAAAQGDYAQRILSALIQPTPAETEGEPVAWLLEHPSHGRTLSEHPITDGDRSLGWVDTPLMPRRAKETVSHG